LDEAGERLARRSDLALVLERIYTRARNKNSMQKEMAHGMTFAL